MTCVHTGSHNKPTHGRRPVGIAFPCAPTAKTELKIPTSNCTCSVQQRQSRKYARAGPRCIDSDKSRNLPKTESIMRYYYIGPSGTPCHI